MITLNSLPSMFTTFSPGHKATNVVLDKIYMAWLFWAVMLQFRLYAMCIYMILCKLYGPRSDCYFMAIWEQTNQGSLCELPYDQVRVYILYAAAVKTGNSFRTKYE